MSAGIFGLWEKQTAILGDRTYHSPVAGKCIWRTKVTERRPQVTDRELIKKRGEPEQDCFGNLLTGGREATARLLVERAMMTMTPAERAAVTPKQKWAAVQAVVDRRHAAGVEKRG